MQKEDTNTAKFAYLLRCDKKLLELFIRFLDAELLDLFDWNKIEVIDQYAFPGGRFDLLITDWSVAAIIECKVGDIQKVYQIENYYNYWYSESGFSPYIFWITRKYANELIGQDKYLRERFSWNDVHDFLNIYLCEEKSKIHYEIQEYKDYLKNEKIILSSNESPEIKKKIKGVPRCFGCNLLSEIGDHFNDCIYKVDEENELPYRILIGRKRWKKEFNDNIPMKVRILMEPDPSLPSNFFFWPRICLFHWGSYLGQKTKYEAKYDYFNKLYPQWLEVCLGSGLELERSAPGKHRRNHNIRLDSPYEIDNSLKVLLAIEPHHIAKERSNFDDSMDCVIKNGVERIQLFLEVVDKFVQTPQN